jgi:hypothetical protein
MSCNMQGSHTCCKILPHSADGFTFFPLKEVMLQIFIAVTNPSSSTGFEPVNLGSSGKHSNHLTTKNNKMHVGLHVKCPLLLSDLSQH